MILGKRPMPSCILWPHLDIAQLLLSPPLVDPVNDRVLDILVLHLQRSDLPIADTYR